MRKLADCIKNSGIRKDYFIYGRSDSIVKNPDVIEKWKEIGLDYVFIGFEFTNDTDLDEFNKKASFSIHQKAIKILQSLDIDIMASFIVKPEFTEVDFNRMRDSILSLELLTLNIVVLTPLPGSELYEEMKN